MKRRIALLTITVLAVLAMGVALSGCGSDGKSDSTKSAGVPTDKVTHAGNGENYVNDTFETISMQSKTTDKKGNVITKYVNPKGQYVTRIEKTNGKVTLIIKDKNGKLIEKKTMKNPSPNSPTKKSDKKQETKKGSQNSDDGWSDFY